jgi:hypothetical protein
MMNRKMKSIILFLILMVCSLSVYAQEEMAKVPFKPSEPPRLFVSPTADIIPSLDFSLAGGSSFGAKGISGQGTAAFGLADIAQIEAHAMGVGRGIEGDNLRPVYAPGFKMMLLKTGMWKHSSGISSPGLAWSLRSSIWNDDLEKNITYKTKLADLYFVATERIGPISLHGGVDILDARFTSDVMERQKKPEAKKTFIGPFGGLDIAITERGKAMAEFGWTADYKYASDGIQQVDDIKPIWVALLGVRFFITRYTALDVGVRYQKNYEGVSDANVEAKLDTYIPTHLIYEYVKR